MIKARNPNAAVVNVFAGGKQVTIVPGASADVDEQDPGVAGLLAAGYLVADEKPEAEEKPRAAKGKKE